MDSNCLIDARGIAKKFCRFLAKSILYGVEDIARNLLQLPAHSGELREAEFWAVRDVSFTLARGETIGIIGNNGSGKSTILKMLSGILMPDRGEIRIRGRVGALIEVGAGFHPLLSGRENIYINGAILGMGKREIDRKFSDIVEFSELGDAIDMPVKYYSSGMFVRLGFSIAAHCRPDILLVDEVLAVGDVPFRVKCHNKMSELSERSSVVIVSHNMSALARVASRCLVLKGGELVFNGPTNEAVQYYYSTCQPADGENTIAGTQEAVLHAVELLDGNQIRCDIFPYGGEMSILLTLSVSPAYPSFIVSLLFLDHEQTVAQCDSEHNGATIENKGGKTIVRLRLPKLAFNPGTYAINVTIHAATRRKYLYWNNNAKQFSVTGDFTGGYSTQLLGEWKTE